MQHAFRRVREVKSFVGDIFIVLKLVLCGVLFCWCIAVIVNEVAANKSGVQYTKALARSVPDKFRDAAGIPK